MKNTKYIITSKSKECKRKPRSVYSNLGKCKRKILKKEI